MTNEQRLKNLSVPTGKIDVVLDTDAYNEIDDQFAISYLLLCKEKLDAKALYAAPFLNERSTSAADGMENTRYEARRHTGDHRGQHSGPYVPAGDHKHNENSAAGTEGTVDGQIGYIQDLIGDINADGHKAPDQALGYGAGQGVEKCHNNLR